MTIISKQAKERNANGNGKLASNLGTGDGYNLTIPAQAPIENMITSKSVSRLRSEVARCRTMSSVWSLQPSVGSWLTQAPRRSQVAGVTTVSAEANTSNLVQLNTRTFCSVAPPVGEVVSMQLDTPSLVKSIAPPVAAVQTTIDPVTPLANRDPLDPSREMGCAYERNQLSPNATSEVATDPVQSPVESSLTSTVMRHDDDDAMFRCTALEEHTRAEPAEVPTRLAEMAEGISIAPPLGIAPVCGIAPVVGSAPLVSIAPPIGIAPPCGIAGA